MTDSPQVTVVQPGARHNFALARFLQRQGMLRRLYTDFALAEDSIAARCVAALPPGPLASKLRRRMVAELPAAKVISDRRPLADVLRETWSGQGGRTPRWSIRQTDREASDIVYTQYFAGGAALRRQFGSGTKVVSDVFIMPSTHRIVNEEAARFPEWGEAAIPDAQVAAYDAHTWSMFEQSDALFCPAQSVADDVAGYDSRLAAKCVLVPYGSSVRFPGEGRPVAGRVLFAGSVQLRKGPQYLKQAADLLAGSEPSIEIVVAGGVSEPARRRLEGGNVRVLGHLSRDEMAREFARADLFAFPTLAEGSAGVVLEAMAAGLPVVTTRSAGVAFTEGRSGIVVAERDPQGLADAILRIVSDRDMRAAMSAHARKEAGLYDDVRWCETFVGALRKVHAEA
ncbi:MAG: glycosyltransferase [Alphaproteobacteria bacterium]|nr:glycosyltransferase [Alphaproteobacteria bacterium]